MFSSSGADRELVFRQAACDPARLPEMMILFKQGGIDVNAAGKESGQTAMHRAAKAGNVKAVQLLFTLGAKIDTVDTAHKTPVEMASDEKTRQVFKHIQEGLSALTARRQFYPKTSRDVLQPAERESYHRVYDQTLEKLNQGSLTADLITSCKARAANLEIPSQEDGALFKKQFQQCVLYLRDLENQVMALREAIKENNYICACGEASAMCFLHLMTLANTSSCFEIMNILDRVDKNAAHALLVINRDVAKTPSDLSGWREALIVDPLFNRIFFYQFVEQYREDTVVKILSYYHLLVTGSSTPARFPDILPFPETKAKYENAIRSLREESRQLLAGRISAQIPDQPALVSLSSSCRM